MVLLNFPVLGEENELVVEKDMYEGSFLFLFFSIGDTWSIC